MPDDVGSDVAEAALEARAAIDSAEALNEQLEESDKLINAFAEKAANAKHSDDLDPTHDSTHDEPLSTNFAEPSSNQDDNDIMHESGERSHDSQEHKPSTDEHEQPEKCPTENELVAAAEKAAATAAASAAALTASLPSTVTVPSISLQGIQPAAYPSFTSLNPNTAQLLAHPMVSMPIQTARRAVRIAPMGVLPLPPHGANPLVPDLPAVTNSIMTTAQEATIDGPIPNASGTVGDMPKGKRRGLSSSVVPSEALTPEERTKQKRMLRNRESAARSRDKRKNRNLQLENSIAKHRAKRELMEKSVEDLQRIVQSMKDILKKHDMSVPT